MFPGLAKRNRIQMTTISFFIELAGILTTDGAAVKACGTPGLFLAQAQQKGARCAQRWGRHATSIAAGRAKESTSRAKMGATRDIFCFRCGKGWHDRRKSSVVSRVIVYNNPKRRLSENSPPQPRRGGRDINKNIAKPPLMERTGWCWSMKMFLVVDQHHPVCAGLGGFAAFS